MYLLYASKEVLILRINFVIVIVRNNVEVKKLIVTFNTLILCVVIGDIILAMLQ